MVIEKEALALIWALQHFSIYIGSSVSLVVYTDHNPVKSLQPVQCPNRRMMRWMLNLQSYSLDIHHVHGWGMHCQEPRALNPSCDNSSCCCLFLFFPLPLQELGVAGEGQEMFMGWYWVGVCVHVRIAPAAFVSMETDDCGVLGGIPFSWGGVTSPPRGASG